MDRTRRQVGSVKRGLLSLSHRRACTRIACLAERQQTRRENSHAADG